VTILNQSEGLNPAEVKSLSHSHLYSMGMTLGLIKLKQEVSSLPAMVASPEEGVVEHLLRRRQPVRGHRRQLERLEPEPGIAAAILGQLFVLPPEGFGQMEVNRAAAADHGQEVALVLVPLDRLTHLKQGSIAFI